MQTSSCALNLLETEIRLKNSTGTFNKLFINLLIVGWASKGKRFLTPKGVSSGRVRKISIVSLLAIRSGAKGYLPMGSLVRVGITVWIRIRARASVRVRAVLLWAIGCLA